MREKSKKNPNSKKKIQKPLVSGNKRFPLKEKTQKIFLLFFYKNKILLKERMEEILNLRDKKGMEGINLTEEKMEENSERMGVNSDPGVNSETEVNQETVVYQETEVNQETKVNQEDETISSPVVINSTKVEIINSEAVVNQKEETSSVVKVNSKVGQVKSPIRLAEQQVKISSQLNPMEKV